jgi:Nif-specific regulatory protein
MEATPEGIGRDGGHGAIPLLLEIAQAVTSDMGIDSAMDAVVQSLASHMPGTRKILLSVLERKSGSISIERAWGLTEEERSRGVYRPGEGVTGQVIQGGASIIVPSMRNDGRFLNRTGSLLPEAGPDASYVCVPVRTAGEVLGSLGMDRPAGSDLIREMEILSIIAAMIAEAVQLHRARMEEQAALQEENSRLRGELEERYRPENIIGNSRPMLGLFSLLKKIYGKDTSVLILGESGTGKELVARALHYHGPRALKPFMGFNCAAIPETMAESELFGHERGAFTGAAARRAGRFEEADGGTLFLDEIGELSPAVQAKLLRVLQTKEFERMGGNETVRVDIRLVAATHRDLASMVREGRFREDLYYRLNVFPLTIPPLRERGGADILLLADHFVERFARKHGNPVKRISTPAIDALTSYHWPGNVRELENAIERAVILSEDGVIHSFHLPPSLQTAASSGTTYRGSLEEKVARVEKESIVEALKESRGNMALAARSLGITERVIALRARSYGIDFHLFRPRSES